MIQRRNRIDRMNLKKDRRYVLRFNVNGVTLVYTGTITSVDDNFVSFIDKFGKEITYNLNSIVSFEEVEE